MVNIVYLLTFRVGKYGKYESRTKKTLGLKKVVGHDFLNYTARNLFHYRSGPWIGILPMVKLQNLLFKRLC